ncbi:hypothetical protein GS491_24080 [Rhodococcus hoagii]|nr:hypothetical protein [Prescottella equi]
MQSSPARRSPYADHTAAELAAARESSKRRIGETRTLIALARQELDRAQGKDSGTAAVDSTVAAVAADEQKIHAVRQAREDLELLRRSGVATRDQLDSAARAVAAAEAAAPPERLWPAIERSAQSNRAIAAQRARAHVTDERVVGSSTTASPAWRRRWRPSAGTSSRSTRRSSAVTAPGHPAPAGATLAARSDPQAADRAEEAPRVDRDHGPDLDM